MLYYFETNDGTGDDAIHKKVTGGKYQYSEGLNRCVMTGDTIFVGGCGHFLEGTPAQMVSAMHRARQLPDDTKVYVGHEYSVATLTWVASVDKNTAAVSQALADFTQ